MPNKAFEAITQLGSYYEQITTANGYYNDIASVKYGAFSFNPTGKGDEELPLVNLIINNITVPEFSTKSCSKTHIEVLVHGYLRKPKNRETSVDSYEDSLNWSKDLRDAFRAYLNGQDGNDVDADLFDSELQQQIGLETNNIVVSSSFTLSFDEKLGVN